MIFDATQPNNLIVLFQGKDITANVIYADDISGELIAEVVKRIQPVAQILDSNGKLIGTTENVPIMEIEGDDKLLSIRVVKTRMNPGDLKIIDWDKYVFRPLDPQVKNFNDYNGDWVYVPRVDNVKETIH